MAESPSKAKRKPSGKRIKLSAICLAIVCAAAAVFSPVQSWWRALYGLAGLDFPERDVFTATFLDVGSADAIIIHAPGCAVLVDGGTYDTGRKIDRYLKRMGINHLDLVVNTHPDRDHLGGFVQVLNDIPADVYWESKIPEELLPKTEEYDLVHKKLAEKGIAVRQMTAGKHVTFGNVSIEVLGPVQTAQEPNDNSLVLKVTCDGCSLLMMGDAQQKEETSLLGENLKCDVLKVGHHGSNTSTSETFLEHASPAYAVISAGKNRPPDEKVLERLEKMDTGVYRTDLDGTITMKIINGKIDFPRNKSIKEIPYEKIDY